MSGFDLSQAAPVVAREDKGIAVHLRDEAGDLMYHGDDKPVTWTVVGTYSGRYRKALDAQADKRFRSRSRQPDDLDQIREDSIDLVADCSLAWDGFYDNGQPLAFSKASAVKVLKLAPWIREQVERAMDDHAGFSRLSSES